MDEPQPPSIVEKGSSSRDPGEHDWLLDPVNLVHDVELAPCPPPYVSPNDSTTNSPPARYFYDSDDTGDDVEVWEPVAIEFYGGSYENSYTYTGISSDQVRLIALAQGKESDPLHCSVKLMDIQKIISQRWKFEALSYAWGTGPPRERIFLQDFAVPNDGKSVDEMMLLMAQQTKPRPFAIRSNLYQALKQIRSETKDVWLWVDAICINQQDNEEKGLQIPKMPAIYGNAWTVTIWIGGSDKSDEAEAAMDFVPSIIDLKLLDRLTVQEGCDVKTLQLWVAFAKLLRRPWFSRRWVVQEVAFARRASIRCGAKIFSWTDFADAVDLFTRKLEVIRSLYDASELSKYDPDALSHVEFTGSRAIVGASNTLIRKTGGHRHLKFLDRLMDLESLVMKFKDLDATDPRNAIYAFLSLANDPERHVLASREVLLSVITPPMPQYNKSAVEVYAEFVEYVVKTTSSLDIICRHWALPISPPLGRKHLKIPSWIGQVKDSAPGHPSCFSGRMNGASLVGDSGHKVYNASGKRDSKVSFGEERGPTDISVLVTSEDQPGSGLKRTHLQSTDTVTAEGQTEDLSARRNKRVKVGGASQEQNHSRTNSDQKDDNRHDTGPQSSTKGQISRFFPGIMFAEGIVMRRVSKVSSRVVDGTISDDSFSILGWKPVDDDKDIKDIVWKTLVADRGSDGKNAPAWYKRACIYALRKTSAEGDLNTSKLIANKSIPESVTEYLKRVQSVVWSRKFFKCYANMSPEPSSRRFKSRWPPRNGELVGLGSKNMREDDLVCILFGCSVPVILRQTGYPEAENSLPVSFIGESFVYGKMDSEIFTDEEMSHRIKEDIIQFRIS